MMDATEGRDDAELVAAVVAGDREAFGPLLERWPPSVLGLCRRVLGPGPQAEDLAQQGATPWLCMQRPKPASWAAAKAMKDTELMELYLTDLFPREEEVDGVMSSALDQPGLRLEMALPFGFDKDPKAARERMAATTEEIQQLLSVDCADSGE
jgi:hypothetical protein